MLEAVYREQRNPGAGIKPETLRLILKLAFALGGLVFFVIAYSTYYYPGSWRDKYTGEPISDSQGFWMAIIFGFVGIVFMIVSWVSGSDRIPLYFNGQMVDNGGRKGTAWHISAAGLMNSSWSEKTIPWSALDYVQDGADDYGDPCFICYFNGKMAVAQYLGEEDAADWNAGVSYVIEVSNTNVSLLQTRDALMQYCPRLFRFYNVPGSQATEETNV
jgi:hypothetical protein